MVCAEIAWQQCVPTANVCRANQHLTDLANTDFPSYVFQLEQVPVAVFCVFVAACSNVTNKYLHVFTVNS